MDGDFQATNRVDDKRVYAFRSAPEGSLFDLPSTPPVAPWAEIEAKLQAEPPGPVWFEISRETLTLTEDQFRIRAWCGAQGRETQQTYNLTGKLFNRFCRRAGFVPIGAEFFRPWATADDDARAQRGNQRLLRMAAFTQLLQPGLMRSLRLLLPPEEADLFTEIQVLRDELVRAADGSGIVFSPRIGALRLEFMREETEEMKEKAINCIRAWRVGTPPELFHAEVMLWFLTDPIGLQLGDVAAAQAFFGELAEYLRNERGDSDWRSWQTYVKHLIAPYDGTIPDVFRPLVDACGEEIDAERAWVEARAKARAEAQRNAEQRVRGEST